MTKETIFDDVAGQPAVYHDDLRCFILQLSYDPLAKRGAVTMLTGNCTDMSGATRLFQSIDPAVETIVTLYPGGTIDTVYEKRCGKWQAICSASPGFIRANSHEN
jgi:hypothetical protein